MSTMTLGPDPNERYPIEDYKNAQFIKNGLKNPNIVVGDYTYYDARHGEAFEDQVLYHFEFLGDHLIIGKFCSIASGTIFLMSGANHKMDGFSTYPFHQFGHGWERFPLGLVSRGDTIVGNDVWIGKDAVIMPGVTIGDGAIIGTRSVVTSDVYPYTIVAGNPTRLIRQRFSDEIINELLNIKWWDWDIETISANIDVITGADVEALKKIVPHY